jgi:hypothetical protein
MDASTRLEQRLAARPCLGRCMEEEHVQMSWGGEQEKNKADARSRHGEQTRRRQWPAATAHSPPPCHHRPWPPAASCLVLYTNPTGGGTDPAMEALDPPDPPVWASISKEDRAGKPRSTSVLRRQRGKGRGSKREREHLNLGSGWAAAGQWPARQRPGLATATAAGWLGPRPRPRAHLARAQRRAVDALAPRPRRGPSHLRSRQGSGLPLRGGARRPRPDTRDRSPP